jgi:hypothetical protein
MENPEGSLACRPYMRAMVGEHVMRQARVDYCAYNRRDMKPTHIWTSVWSWVQRGTIGDGRCQGRGACHEESITGGKRKRGAGQGTKAAKSAVPVQLLEEWYLIFLSHDERPAPAVGGLMTPLRWGEHPRGEKRTRSTLD